MQVQSQRHVGFDSQKLVATVDPHLSEHPVPRSQTSKYSDTVKPVQQPHDLAGHPLAIYQPVG